MINYENLAKAIEMIEQQYNPDANGGCYWEITDCDDIFDLGYNNGYRDALLTIGDFLGLKLPTPKQPNKSY